VLEDVVSTESKISQIQNRDIQYHEAMPELSNTIPNTTFVEAILVPLSQKQLTDPPSPKMMCEAEIDIAQDSLPGDRVIHDCQELMGFSDIF